MPETTNPFAQFDPAPPTSPNTNPFAQFDPAPPAPSLDMKTATPATGPNGEKIFSNNGEDWFTADGKPYVAPPSPATMHPPAGFTVDQPPSAFKTFLHSAERSLLPAGASLAGAGYGAGVGATIGAAIPVLGETGIGEAGGAVIGGILGGLGLGYGAEKAQNEATKYVPESVKEEFGQGAEQQAAEAKAHPVAEFLGENAPYFAALKPFGKVPELAEDAGAFQRLMHNPIAQRVVPATLMGGQEAITEKAQGEPLNPWEIGGSALMGAALPHETELGRRITGAGEAAATATTNAARRIFSPAEQTDAAQRQTLIQDTQQPPPPASGAVTAPETPPGSPPAGGGAGAVLAGAEANAEADAARPATVPGTATPTPPRATRAPNAERAADLDVLNDIAGMTQAGKSSQDIVGALGLRLKPIYDEAVGSQRGPGQVAQDFVENVQREMGLAPNTYRTETEINGNTNVETGETTPPSQTGFPEAFAIGKGATDQLYTGLFGALQRGEDTFAGVRDPVLAQAKPAFDAGIIKSPEDLRSFVEAGYDPKKAGLAPTPPAETSPAEQVVAEPQTEPVNAPEPQAGPVNFKGLGITITNPAGSVRRGVGADGQPWETPLPPDTSYGYVKRTNGADGEQVDAYVGPDRESDKAFIVDQIDPATGAFDEHKIMLGYPDAEAARNAYIKAFSDGSGPARLGGMFETNVNGARYWLEFGDQSKPVTALSTVKKPETSPAADIPIQQFNHTRTGEPLFAVQPPYKAGSPEFKVLGKFAREAGGRYSTFNRDGAIPGFLFKNHDTAERFVDRIRQMQGEAAAVASKTPQPTTTAKPTVATAEDIQRDRERTSPLWDIGHHLVTDGEVLRTISGRLTAPAPKTSNFTYRRARNALDGWLLNEAKTEAKISGNVFLLRRLDTEQADNIPPATRDELNNIVFGSDRPTAANRVTQQNLPTKPPTLPPPQQPAFKPASAPLPTTPAADIGTPDSFDTVKLADRFAQAFAAGQRFSTIIDARKFAADLLGGPVTQPAARKALDEAIEGGVTIHARNIVDAARLNGLTPDETYDALVDLYDRQPGLNERNADSLNRQAYSTPAPIAYLASRLADVTPETTVYEPTAGNGMLLMEANPDHVIANEIDPARARFLRETYPNVTVDDAAVVNPATGVDTVLANPPFGKIRDYTTGVNKRWQTPDYITQDVDHAIVFKALEAMKDDGTATLIIGSKPEIGGEGTERRQAFYRSDENRAFFKSLYDRYHVTDHFTVSGDLYKKQGAGWPIDIIRIAGRGQSDLPLPAQQAPRIYDTFDSLKEKLNAARTVGTPEQQPNDHGDHGAPGHTQPGPVLGPNGGQGGPNDQGSGGGRGAGANPSGVPGRPLLPEPPAGNVGENNGGNGGRPGENGDRGRDTGNAVPGGGQGTEPVGQEGATGGGPGSVAKPGGAIGIGGLTQEELDAFNSLFGGEPAGQSSAPTTPPSAPTAPSPNPRPEGPTPPTSAPSKAPGNENNLPPANDWRSGLGKLFEETLPERRWLPGVDPDHYEKALPYFVSAVGEFGYRPGDNLVPLMTKLAHELALPPDRLAALRPYLLQFVSDVKAGFVLNDKNDLLDAPPPQPTDESVSQRRENQETETALQVHYTPSSNARAVGTLVPVNMQTAITQALGDIETRVGDIDDFVAKKLGYSKTQVVGTARQREQESLASDPYESALRPGLRPELQWKPPAELVPGIFSAEQVDALAMAIDNLDRGAGFIIGDQTGVGKGRVVAGIIRYAMKKGLTPIFITQQPALYADMYRDLHDIGMDKFKALVTNADLTGGKRIPIGGTQFIESLPPAQLKAAWQHVVKTGSLPPGHDALFTTYSQMQTPGGEEKGRHLALQRLAPNALIIMDESHEAGGTATRKIDKETGMPVGGRAKFARDLLANAEGAFYSSATYAKNPHVMSLYFRTDMPLAVDGNVEKLVGMIKQGGVPLQQVIANMLTEAGQYVRRERSYDGVEFRIQTVPSDVATAERVSDLLKRIFNFDQRMAFAREAFAEHLITTTGDVLGGDNAIGHLGVEGVNFSGIMHNVIGQSLLALKARQVVDEAIAAHGRQEKPVIALSNTFGALLDRYIEEEGLKSGDDVSGLTFNRVFRNYLDRTRQVTIKHPFDEKLNQRHYITDDELKEIGYDHLIDEFNKERDTIGAADLGGMPGSPLDYIQSELNKAGIKIGEITGRQTVIKDGVLAKRDESNAAKKRAMNAFNAGDLDALLINRSGSTGFSLHASEKYRDQRQRHMILMQADPNIDTFMQILGRIHRTGQVVLPRYSLMITDLPAEKRPAAVLMKKLASLNANTSANRESAISLDNVTDLMNMYGDWVVSSLLYDEPELANLLDVAPKEDGGYGDGILAKATGRLAILPINRQEEIWGRIEQNYRDLIDSLDRTGQNSLVARTLDLDARILSSRPISDDLNIDSPFAKPAFLEHVDVKKPGKPYTIQEVADRVTNIAGSTDRQKIADRAESVIRDLRDRAADYRDQMNSNMVEAQQEADAIRAHPNFDDDAKNKGLKATLQKVEARVRRYAKQIGEYDLSVSRLADFIREYQPLKPVSFVSGSGDNALRFPAVVLDVTNNGKAINPAANSAWTMHLAIADGAREIKVPFSQFVSNQASITPMSGSDVRDAFERGQTVSREQRDMVTGNLVAGYNKFNGKGQFVIYRDSDGNTKPGILLPRGLDAEEELAKQPVMLNSEQGMDFIDRVYHAEGHSGVLTSSDGLFSIQRIQDRNRYLLQVVNRGGAHYFKPRDVNAMLGADAYAQRKGGKVWQATADRERAQKVLEWYEKNLGSKFEAHADKDHADAIRAESRGTAAEEKLPPEPETSGSHPLRDMLADYRQFAASARVGNNVGPHELAQEWVVRRGLETGHEHMAIVDSETGEVTHSVTNGLPDAVDVPPDVMARVAQTYSKANLVVHHNHPGGSATSPSDLGLLTAPGIKAIVAHNHDGLLSMAKLSETTGKSLAAKTVEQRYNELWPVIDNAREIVERRLRPLIKTEHNPDGMVTKDQADRLFGDLTARALEKAGVIDYFSDHDSTVHGLPDHYAKSIIRDAAIATRQQLNPKIFPERSAAEWSAILNRPTRPLGAKEETGRFFSEDADAGSERPQRSGRDQAGGEGAERPAARRLSQAREEKFDDAEFGTPEERDRDLAAVMHTDNRGPLDRVRSWIDGMRDNGLNKALQYWTDRLTGLAAAEKGRNGGKLLDASVSPTQFAKFARNHASVTNYFINHGQGRFNSGTGVIEPIKDAKGLTELLEPITKLGSVGINDFKRWLIAQRAQKLREEGRENNVSDEFIDKYIHLDKLYDYNGGNTFRDVQRELQGWNRSLLDLAQTTGLINAQSRKLFEHDEYVPFFRALDNDEIGGPRSTTGGPGRTRSPIRALKGGKSQINDVFENLAMNASAIIRRSMENEVMRRTADELIGMKTLIPMSKSERQGIESQADARSHTAVAGLDPRIIDAAKEEARGLFGALKRHDADVVTFMRDGKPVYYRVQDPLLLRSLVSIGPQSIGAFGKLFSAPARLLRASVIFDPAFMLSHNLRMATHSFMLTGVNPVASISRAIRNAKGLDPVALKMMAAGAMGGHYDIDLPRHVRMQIESPTYQASLLNTPLKVAAFLKRASEVGMRASDVGPRVAVYEKAIREGMTEAEALDRARDLLDFSTHGDGSAAMFLAHSIPFLNARWQGIARSVRGLAGEERNAILLRGALVTAATLALYAENQQDHKQEWDQLEDWDKQYAWHIWLDGIDYRIPKPFELGALFGSVPEIVADYMNDGNLRHVQQAAGSMFSNVFKFNPVPVAVRPAVEAYFNTDMFTGRPIVNEAEQGLAPDYRYGPGTSPSIIAATQAFNAVSPVQVAPDMVQHLLQGYLAGWGTYLASAADWLGAQEGALPTKAAPRLNDYPVVGRFMHETPEASNRIQTDFYDLKSDIDQVGTTIKHFRDAGDLATMQWLMQNHPEFSPGLRKTLDQAGRLLAQRRKILQRVESSPTMSAEQKRNAVDSFYVWRDQYLTKLSPIIQRAQSVQ